MKFLRHKWRVLAEWFGLLVAAVMVILAIVSYAGGCQWTISGQTFMTIAGVALLAAIYLVLDEIRLSKLS